MHSVDIQRPKPFHSRITDNHNPVYLNKNLEEEYIALVPCRWKETGWKYVRKDPKEEAYFSNPNRVNYTGFNAKERSLNKTTLMPSIK